MSAVFPLTFLSLQKAEPHKQVMAPTNEERLHAFRRVAPVVHTNNNFFPQGRPSESRADTPRPIGRAALSSFEVK